MLSRLRSKFQTQTNKILTKIGGRNFHLKNTVQVVVFADCPAPDLLSVAGPEEYASSFSATWRRRRARVRLTWHSEYSEESTLGLTSASPDIVCIVQSGTTFPDRQTLELSRSRMEGIYHDADAGKVGNGPGLVLMVINEGMAHFSDNLLCRFLSLDLEAAIKCRAGCFRAFDMSNACERNIFLETLWELGSVVRRRNEEIKNFYSAMNGGDQRENVVDHEGQQMKPGFHRHFMRERRKRSRNEYHEVDGKEGMCENGSVRKDRPVLVGRPIRRHSIHDFRTPSSYGQNAVSFGCYGHMESSSSGDSYSQSQNGSLNHGNDSSYGVSEYEYSSNESSSSGSYDDYGHDQTGSNRSTVDIYLTSEDGSLLCENGSFHSVTE